MTIQSNDAVYQALNPVGDREASKYSGINPRLDTLAGKTIGLFDNAKRECPYVLAKIEKLLMKQFPDLKISWFKKGTYKAVMWDAEKEWAKDLDGVIAMSAN